MALKGPSAAIYINPSNPHEIERIDVGALNYNSCYSEQLIDADLISGDKIYKVRLSLQTSADGTYFSKVNVEPASEHYDDMNALTTVDDYKYHILQACTQPTCRYFNSGEMFKELNQDITQPPDELKINSAETSLNSTAPFIQPVPSNPFGQPTLDSYGDKVFSDNKTITPISGINDISTSLTEENSIAQPLAEGLNKINIDKKIKLTGDLCDYKQTNSR